MSTMEINLLQTAHATTLHSEVYFGTSVAYSGIPEYLHHSGTGGPENRSHGSIGPSQGIAFQCRSGQEFWIHPRHLRARSPEVIRVPVAPRDDHLRRGSERRLFEHAGGAASRTKGLGRLL